VTLNSLIESHFGDDPIDLCKIDIEGTEGKRPRAAACCP
jgi:hypothetical protein